ncbi:SDR family oxidoreductase [Isoalcanivorax indicus]|uniref:SDR family oxidoreductase n=1 Tax=Isoalcanivorax indicus TaxID=2202653 RepID=UPI000DB9BA78|nr:SDR family oxidoreductase [Isoalcanivorax indicus]
MNHTILITGAASGIGAATARLFHQRGWQVGLLDISADALATLASELGNAWHQPLDVRDAEAAQQAVNDFAHSAGGLRVLFNCAGVLQVGHFEDISAAAHARIIGINVQGVINMTLAALPWLQGAREPLVINMSSASALYGVPHLASYSASKFAVRGLTEALDIEWRRHGIRVCDLMPPFVNTPMVRDQPFRAPVVDRLGVHLSAEDIAEAAWKALKKPAVHHPIGLQFAGTMLLEKLAPRAFTRRLMSFLSR